MEKTDEGLDRLCGVYERLNNDEKGKIIRLAEGLLISQNDLQVRVFSVEKMKKKS